MDDSFGCKLGRVAERYDLDPEDAGSSIDGQLRDRWLGEHGQGEHGYRTLTEWFNRRLLKRIYDERGRDATGARLESDYEALVGDDELTRLEVVDDLAADGIDAEAVLEDMISWSTMRTHLTECLGLEKERREASTDWERESIEIATDRAAEKIEEAVGSLASKGVVAGASSAAVNLEVELECDQCATTVPLVVALDRGYVCATHDRPEVTA